MRGHADIPGPVFVLVALAERPCDFVAAAHKRENLGVCSMPMAAKKRSFENADNRSTLLARRN